MRVSGDPRGRRGTGGGTRLLKVSSSLHLNHNTSTIVLFLKQSSTLSMSTLSIHKAALEGEDSLLPLVQPRDLHDEAHQSFPPFLSGQPGLVRSLLNANPHAINSKDEVSIFVLPLVFSG